MNRRQFMRNTSLFAGGGSLGSLLSEGKSSLLAKLPLQSSRGSRASLQTPKNEWFVEVGLQKQLFADDYIISERRNVTRELGKISKVNEGRPIFNDAWWATTVLHDGRLFRMWYTTKEQGFSLATEGKWAGAYAESEDGMSWTKKAYVTGLPFLYGPVWIDPHETDPDHKFKIATRLNPAPPERLGLTPTLAHSADGLRWTLYNDGRPVTGPSGDFTNQIAWDEKARVYRLFIRDEDAILDEPIISRGVRLLINPDLKANPTDWTSVRSWKLDRMGRVDYARRQIYHMNDWYYEGIHFGLIAVYEWPTDISEGPYNPNKRHERDIMNFYISTSRDAENWDFSWVYSEKPLIPRGPVGGFDNDAVYPCPTVVTYADKHWLYYCGGKERHNAYAHFYDRQRKERYPGAIEKYSNAIRDQYNTCLATMRLDGALCLEASGEVGTVLTKPFRLDGTRVAVNVEAQGGEVRMEVLEPQQTGIPITNYTKEDSTAYREVDELRLRPRWKNHSDLASLRGKIVRLKFYLNNAKLYSFQVQP